MFLEAYAAEVGLEYERLEVCRRMALAPRPHLCTPSVVHSACFIVSVQLSNGRSVVLMTWRGSQPELPTLVLNSHMDVVPVFPELWSVDPWAAVEKDGKIYGRGTQDMKCVGIQYIEAVVRCATLQRTNNTNALKLPAPHTVSSTVLFVAFASTV